MTTPPPPQGSSPNLPDRRYFVTENEHYEFESLDRPVTPYQTCASGEYKPTRTLRTWFVGEDGRTSIERERDALREKFESVPDRIRQLSQFVEPQYSEKIYQLAEVAEVIEFWTNPTQQEPDDE